MLFEKKCRKCGNWCEGRKLECNECHNPLRAMRLRDRLIRMRRDDPFEINWFEVSPTDAPVMVFSKYIARIVSYFLLGIAVFFTILIVIATGIY
jgi:Zn-dependent alcohol dehydrogenase